MLFSMKIVHGISDRLKMSRSRSRSPTRSRSRSPPCPRDIQSKDWRSLFVGYLPNHATMDDVENFFKGFGQIEAISLKPGYGT